jgi:hypothetical protein
MTQMGIDWGHAAMKEKLTNAQSRRSKQRASVVGAGGCLVAFRQQTNKIMVVLSCSEQADMMTGPRVLEYRL